MRLLYMLSALLFVLCSCQGGTEVASKPEIALAFENAKALNFSNGGRFAESQDGAVYYYLNEGEETGIFEWDNSESEHCLVEESVRAIYLNGDIMYFIARKEGTLWALTLPTGETIELCDKTVGSVVGTESGLYFLARESMDTPFKLYCYSDELQKIELTGIDENINLRYLYEIDDIIYIVGGNSVYRLEENFEAKPFIEAEEPLHKFFRLGENFYVVGNASIYKENTEGPNNLLSISPNYIGLSATVTTVNDKVIYSGLGGTYEFDNATERTRKITDEVYQEIYVVNNKLIGVLSSAEKFEFEEIR